MPQAYQIVQLVVDYMKSKGIDVCCHVEGTCNDQLLFSKRISLPEV